MLRGGAGKLRRNEAPGPGGPIYFNVYKEGMSGAPQGTDIWAVENGYVSVTPMKVGETGPALIDALKAWFK